MPHRNKKTAVFFAILILIFLTDKAFAKSPVFPAWYTDDGLEENYPSAKFIRERGSGKTKQDAENDAVSYISRYFETEASISSISTVNAVSTDEKTTITETLNIQQAISSNMKLFGIKFSDRYYNKKEKTWYVVAYIDINDAWNRYEPEISMERDEFMAYYEEALNELEPIKKIQLLTDALKEGQNFNEKLSFANALSKKLTKKSFGNDIQTLSNLPSLIKKTQMDNPVYISVNDDYIGLIQSSVRKVFNQKGFIVTTTQSVSAYVAQIQVLYNRADDGNYVVLYPFLTLSITGKNGSLYAFNAESERCVAPTEQAAKKVAAENLISEIEENLAKDMLNVLGI